MELKVEGSDLQKLLEGAVAQALGEAGREALVKEVVRYLTSVPSGGGYGSRESSPLMKALEGAAYTAALKFFNEKMASEPDMVTAFESLYVDAMKKFHDNEHREKLTTKMSEKLSEAFGRGY